MRSVKISPDVGSGHRDRAVVPWLYGGNGLRPSKGRENGSSSFPNHLRLCVMLTFAIPVVFIVGAIIVAFPAILAVAAVLGVLILLIKIFRS